MRSNKVSNKVQTMFCKVCKDAGKPENVYGSHCPKDVEGNLTCPTLKSQECRFCHNKGHTTKYCKELEKKNKMDLKEEKEREKASRAQHYENTKQIQSKKIEKNKSLFAAAFDSDSDEEDKKRVKKQAKKQAKKGTTETINTSSASVKQEETILKEELFPLLQSSKVAKNKDTNSLTNSLTHSTNISLKISYLDAVSLIPAIISKMDVETTNIHFTSKPTQKKEKNTININDCFTGKNGLTWADAWSDDDE